MLIPEQDAILSERYRNPQMPRMRCLLCATQPWKPVSTEGWSSHGRRLREHRRPEAKNCVWLNLLNVSSRNCDDRASPGLTVALAIPWPANDSNVEGELRVQGEHDSVNGGAELSGGRS
jgi:hypothetical protein